MFLTYLVLNLKRSEFVLIFIQLNLDWPYLIWSRCAWKKFKLGALDIRVEWSRCKTSIINGSYFKTSMIIVKLRLDATSFVLLMPPNFVKKWLFWKSNIEDPSGKLFLSIDRIVFTLSTIAMLLHVNMCHIINELWPFEAIEIFTLTTMAPWVVDQKRLS